METVLSLKKSRRVVTTISVITTILIASIALTACTGKTITYGIQICPRVI